MSLNSNRLGGEKIREEIRQAADSQKQVADDQMR